jgi:hypothetical protein
MVTGEPLEGLAAADALLGRPFPLPAVVLPLARWVEVRAAGPAAAEIEWNLDDSRSDAPGRLALYAGADPPDDQMPPDAEQSTVTAGSCAVVVRRSPLEDAQPSLKPVQELSWFAAGMHLRLTAQGPWRLDDLLALVTSMSL